MDPLLLQLLRASSRTFAIGIERLPDALREAVGTAYLLLRVADYLEDNELMAPARKAELLRLWARTIAGDAAPDDFVRQLELPAPLTPDAQVAQDAARVIDALRALPEPARTIVGRHVCDSAHGMARWVERGPRFHTESDLDDYMHEVAGRVGYLLTELFTGYSRAIRRKSAALMTLAREFGLALQTVNVIRGLRKDFERGWIYVPESFLDSASTPRESLFEPRNRDLALRVLERLASKAERHLQAARAYVETLPRRHHAVRLFCLFPLLFAVRTLAISRGNEDVFRDEAKITRGEVAKIVRRGTLFGWSNAWVRRQCLQRSQ